MNRKKKIYKQHKQYECEVKHQKLTEAGYIKDKFSNVAEITFEFIFTDPDDLMSTINDKYKRLPEHSAFFEFDCPNRECVRGGFNLTKPIVDMLKNNENEISGTIRCKGWQDYERINLHICDIELAYKITAKYIKV